MGKNENENCSTSIKKCKPSITNIENKKSKNKLWYTINFEDTDTEKKISVLLTICKCDAKKVEFV